jgi:diguanylate cyclase (GGDEF)-like protein
VKMEDSESTMSAIDFPGRERRGGGAQLKWQGPHPEDFWMPERSEVVIQFMTRILFFGLGVMFFTAVSGIRPVLVGVNVILTCYGIYFVVVSLMFWRALTSLSFGMIRSAMLLDTFMITLSLIHDPYPVPPSALAYLMVILGNGMRYGTRMFIESVSVAIFGMALAYALRYRLGGFEVSAADVFFGVFWLVIVLYSYILLARINLQHRILDYRSRRDELTRVLNRHGIAAMAQELLGNSGDKPIAILFADLNSFKQINDRFGHAVGDRVLVEFSQIFADSAETQAVGRWGGDEFVAVFPATEDKVREIIQRIELRLKIWSESNGLPVSVSLGYSLAPRDGQDLVTLISVADIDLYRRKAEPIYNPVPILSG